MVDILVVEDNIEMAALLCDFLEADGYSVKHCADGDSAVNAFESEGARLVILDIMLQDYSEQIALVAHGGTIMTLLAALGLPERGYYDWQTGNCCGYVVTPEGEHLRVLREL